MLASSNLCSLFSSPRTKKINKVLPWQLAQPGQVPCGHDGFSANWRVTVEIITAHRLARFPKSNMLIAQSDTETPCLHGYRVPPISESPECTANAPWKVYNKYTSKVLVNCQNLNFEVKFELLDSSCRVLASSHQKQGPAQQHESRVHHPAAPHEPNLQQPCTIDWNGLFDNWKHSFKRKGYKVNTLFIIQTLLSDIDTSERILHAFKYLSPARRVFTFARVSLVHVTAFLHQLNQCQEQRLFQRLRHLLEIWDLYLNTLVKGCLNK